MELPQGPLSLGPVPVVVYGAMFGGTVAGQLVGMLFCRVLGGHPQLLPVLLPIACSVLLEAVVGAGLGRARVGRPLRTGECAWVSAYYSLLLGAVTFPLAACSLAATKQESGRTAGQAVAGLGLALGILLLATVARHALMALLSSRRSP